MIAGRPTAEDGSSPRARPAPRAVVARLLGPCVLYVVLVVWLTWPLAAHLGSRRPATFPGAEFDPLYSAWVLSWETHALVTGHLLSVGDANIYHPDPGALFYGPLALGALPYFGPVYLLSGNPVLALNALFLASLVLSATAVHAVVRRWTGLHAAGVVAATALLANRWLLWTFIPTVPHLAVLWYLPIIVWSTAVTRFDRRHTALVIGLVLLQCLTDVVYVAPAVLAGLLACALLDVVGRTRRERGRRLLLAGGVAMLVVALVHLPYLGVARRNPQLASQTYWVRRAPAPLALPGGLFGFLSPLAIATLAPALVALGGTLVLRGGTSAVERAAWRRALVWTAVGIVVSLPTGPAVLGERLPLGAALRSPERLRVVALVGLALLTGLGFAAIARRVARDDRRLHALLAAATAALIYVQYAYAVLQPAAFGPRFPSSYPLVATPSAASPVLAVLRREGGPTLELPLPRTTVFPATPASQAVAMYRSIFHWQPLLNGYASYWPAGFAARMDAARRLPAADALQALRRDAGLAWVLVRTHDDAPLEAPLAAARAPWLALARAGGRPDLELVAADDDLLLFRVRDAPPEPARQDIREGTLTEDRSRR